MVAGGGNVGQRKVLTLLDAQADVTVISPELTPALSDLTAGGRVSHIKRGYLKGDLEGAFLVIAATEDPVLNARIAADCQCLVNVLVNVVDTPGSGNFIVPSTLMRPRLQIAVSTSGISPALARTVRWELEPLFTEEIDRYLEFLEGFRQRVLTVLANSGKAGELLKEAGSPGTLAMLRQCGPEPLMEMLLARLMEINETGTGG